METLKTALNLVKLNACFGSLNLRQAYYSLPIQKDSPKFLRFIWEGVIYEYSSLPNGLMSGPRIFSKLLEPMYSALRKDTQMLHILMVVFYSRTPMKNVLEIFQIRYG